MGGCQNYGPFLGTLNIRGHIIIGTQKRDHNFDNRSYENFEPEQGPYLPTRPCDNHTGVLLKNLNSVTIMGIYSK